MQRLQARRVGIAELLYRCVPVFCELACAVHCDVSKLCPLSALVNVSVAPSKMRESFAARCVGRKGRGDKRKGKKGRGEDRFPGSGDGENRDMSLRGARRRSNLNSWDGRLLRFARNDMTSESPICGCGRRPHWGFRESAFPRRVYFRIDVDDAPLDNMDRKDPEFIE
jgi:hypothetical protein